MRKSKINYYWAYIDKKEILVRIICIGILIDGIILGTGRMLSLKSRQILREYEIVSKTAHKNLFRIFLNQYRTEIRRNS